MSNIRKYGPPSYSVAVIHGGPGAPGSPGIIPVLRCTEAMELRRSGRLLEMGKRIVCPVTAIHGDYDPHPAEGVQNPLAGVLKGFRFILLKECGHEPWKELRTREEFFRLLVDELA